MLTARGGCYLRAHPEEGAFCTEGEGSSEESVGAATWQALVWAGDTSTRRKACREGSGIQISTLPRKLGKLWGFGLRARGLPQVCLGDRQGERPWRTDVN